jgi:hypothetical protein
MTDAVAFIRRFCMALPEVTERPSHGTPTWFVRDKKAFAYCWPHGHHDNEFAHAWCAAAAGVARDLIERQPDTYFRPPYVGHRGWVGVRLDGLDLDELAEVLEDGYRSIAPATLIAVLDASAPKD